MANWSSEEDVVLIELNARGFGWNYIARVLNTTKTPHDCAARWNNVLRPGINDESPFDLIERTTLNELYQTHGARWSRIASHLGRSPRAVKEMWLQMQMEPE
ncbi:11373_t:CDS:2 [Paraglomus occultum]|uniref:11373_t:CDS:1 n=1 Tax=Paraglomus occultum TaxID=144539 RepID=A0A9N8W6R5_9GLOM|nr:11373_t:CDS:2 [Paraglomus occultum]